MLVERVRTNIDVLEKDLVLIKIIQFFVRVLKTPKLHVCVQVRAKALKTLNMAHTVGPRSTLFPVNDVVRMLMFRTTAEVTDFVQQYGLNVNDG